MQNVVSFETARRLKEAGFKQPEPEFGQVWYSKRGVEAVVGGNRFGSEYYAMICGGQTIVLERKNIVFAPAATDILPGECFLCLEVSYKTASGQRWVIYDQDTLELLCKNEPETDNPAEAAALAWLAINEKQ